MAAPLGRHCTLLLWSSVAEAPLLSAGAPAVCNASTVVGGARLTRLTDLTTEPRPPPLPASPLREGDHEKKMVIKPQEAEKRRNKVTVHARSYRYYPEKSVCPEIPW